MSDYQQIKVESSPGRLDIILNSPPVNILNIAMMEEISDAVNDAATDTSLCALVFRAEGKHFSAGADVGEHQEDKVAEMINSFGRMFRRISEVGAVTVAVVQGSALGGGCELATFCDIVLASDQAKFGQPEIQLGVFPPVAVVTFPILIGRNRAIELLTTGKIIGAVEAERIGLINHVFPAGEFDEKVSSFIGSLTSLSAVAISLTKKSLDLSMYLPVMEGLRQADRCYVEELMSTDDAHEGLAAFLEKRKAVWKNM
ncbi:hypothetical protein CEE37_09950 [candidate division LCP-89 bacterium B3_LCP]|uniref:Enoyl-CoA hydratase n=1 Tax=candidate division LCP-89 bacterium B3_LCP TaxID=2012998 RepID=A0A532UYN0_UNCL8|nr:MAG: hypothetical protein CEE37_09950 [candidate division LCP-89 bacterium B3_LCP]